MVSSLALGQSVFPMTEIHQQARICARDRFTIVAVGCLSVLAGMQWAVADTTNDRTMITIDRSPVAVAVSPEKSHALSANRTSGTVSLVKLSTGQVLDEIEVGSLPADVVWFDSVSAAVSVRGDDRIAWLKIEQNRMSVDSTSHVGDEPSGIAVDRPKNPASGVSRRLFVAVSGADEIAAFDVGSRELICRIRVGGDPRDISVTPNQKWLVTCCSVPGELFVHDATSFELISRRLVFDDAFNLGAAAITNDSKTCIFPSQINRAFPVSFDNVDKGWVIDNRLTKMPIPDGEYWQQKQMGLDLRGDGAGDLHAVAISPTGDWLVATCGGTHEALILKLKETKWPNAHPGDFLPEWLRNDTEIIRRVRLGGRPLGVQFIDDEHAIVANYFLNALQIVDARNARLVRTIELGGPETPSVNRRGEMVFYDADRSRGGWFSCHTCHTDGHTCEQKFDTVNDGNFDTYKLAPSLRGVTQTAPWTWHGWQPSLGASIAKSMQETLHTEMPISDREVDALLAYLSTLEHPASPYRNESGALSDAAERGRRLFENKAGCMTCHQPPRFTSSATYSVGLEPANSFFKEFNPPSLLGVNSKRRFLHDGRARSLTEVLTRHHRAEFLAGEELSIEEMADVVAYLKSL